MEGEVNNFIWVWTLILASLYYSHTIGKYFHKGNTIRPLALLPVVCLFLVIPLNLTTLCLGGTTSFFIAWLANFKLILFAFGQGPLSSNPPLPLSHFVALTCLPIKFQQFPSKFISEQSYSSREIAKNGHKSLLNYVSKFLILLVCIRVYHYNQFIHPKIIWFFYCIHLYVTLELLLAIVAAVARSLYKVQLEPQFDEPYLATSIQDFWGKRWNLMVSNILRPIIYGPVLCFSTTLIGRKWAALPATLMAFFVSGLMHELVFYNILRVKPTGEFTCFFLINGAALALEASIKRALKGRFMLPKILCTSLTLTFVVWSSFLLFFPPLLRGKADVKACAETLAVMEFVKSGRLVSPNDFSCSFL